MEIQGKTALIAGASRPLGRAIARAFARQGALLILPTFDWPESIAEMEEEFTDQSYDFISMRTDLRNEDDVTTLTRTVAQRGHGLDYLVNNIERGGMPVVHGSYDHPQNNDQWQLEMDTTLKAKWLLFRHCLPLLKKGRDPAVVNISSIAGCCGRSGAGCYFFNDAYSGANRAVGLFTETWAREGAPEVRVNELSLGLIHSRHGEHTRGWSQLGEQEKFQIYEQILLERIGRPEEVAAAVYFLAVSATYMTGSIIKMDGGFTLGALKVPPMPQGIL